MGSVAVVRDSVAPRHVGASWIKAGTVSPALAGRFSTSGPPGKSRSFDFYYEGCTSFSPPVTPTTHIDFLSPHPPKIVNHNFGEISD